MKCPLCGGTGAVITQAEADLLQCLALLARFQTIPKDRPDVAVRELKILMKQIRKLQRHLNQLDTKADAGL